MGPIGFNIRERISSLSRLMVMVMGLLFFSLLARPSVALADFTYSFSGGSTVTVSDDLSVVTGQVHVKPDTYSVNTGYNSTTFIVDMPDAGRETGYCYEAFQGQLDHLQYPEPGECTVPFRATRIGTSNKYEFVIDTTRATTFAPWVSGSSTHVKQKVIVPSHSLFFECSLRVDKVSGSSSIAQGSSAYSLNGARYGVYSSRTAAMRDFEREATIVITSSAGSLNGTSTPVTGLPAGTHWVQELRSGDGYLLETEPVSVNLTPANLNVLTITEGLVTYTAPTVEKRDANRVSGSSIPQGDASFGDTWVKFDYYAGMTASGSPTRTWYVSTDADGMAKLDADHLVGSSDALYMYDLDENGVAEVVIPRGVVVVSEFKAPLGYERNPNTLTLVFDGNYTRPYGRLRV